MPIRLAVINTANSNTLAFRELTDAQVARIKAVYPGTTAETANAVLDFLVKALRGQARNEGGNAQRALDNATLATNQATHNAAFDSEWTP